MHVTSNFPSKSFSICRVPVRRLIVAHFVRSELLYALTLFVEQLELLPTDKAHVSSNKPHNRHLRFPQLPLEEVEEAGGLRTSFPDYPS